MVTDFLATVVSGEFERWDTESDPEPGGVDDAYAASLQRARERTGVDESVCTGAGDVAGVRTALIVSEFGFLGGSIGAVAGARITAAIRRATAEGLPVLAVPASGGTRMQEGTPAFLQMVAITAAVVDHRRAGLPYLVYLRHPTTGGVFASWGSLGQATWGEPGALIGFLGPRVYAGLRGHPFPDGVQTAENLLEHGVIDDIVAPAHVAERAARFFRSTGHGRPRPSTVEAPTLARSRVRPGHPSGEGASADAWSAVLATRDPRRRGLRELLAAADAEIVAAPGVLVVALAQFGDRRVVVAGHDRAAEFDGRELGAADLRLARRAITLAAELELPLVTVIDTAGAALSAEAENSGLATEIARCLAEVLQTPSSTTSVLLGRGTGGAALALFPADHVIATEDSWLAPLPPEGASIIVHGEPDRAAELVGPQEISAVALAARGIVDDVVPGGGGLVAAVAGALAAHLSGEATDG